jgi:predicted nucleotidyltransferase
VILQLTFAFSCIIFSQSSKEKNMPKARTQIDFDSIENRPRRVTPKVIRAVCDRIIEKVRPEKIVLFGSHAKGVATKDSDLDLLVIIDVANPLASLKRRDRYGEILRLLRHRGFGLDVIVVTNKELEKIINENEGEWNLILEILDEGRTLHEQRAQIE